MALSTSANAQAYLDCHFAPGYEQSGPKRNYTPDNLFDYRDGAAEGYLIYSFVRMQGIDCQSSSTVFSIDVSDMTDADMAYGMFSANRDPKTTHCQNRHGRPAPAAEPLVCERQVLRRNHRNRRQY